MKRFMLGMVILLLTITGACFATPNYGKPVHCQDTRLSPTVSAKKQIQYNEFNPVRHFKWNGPALPA